MAEAKRAPAVETRGPSLLAPLAGERPSMPGWAAAALASAPETGRLAGLDIEWLAWGRRGDPGLMLLHGNGAHAGWWRPIGPLFPGRRVVTLSWPGMGGSGHRKAYALGDFVEAARGVADAAGLWDGGPPTVVGHSFGGFPMMAWMGDEGERFARAIILDTPFSGSRRRPSNAMLRPHRIYPTLEAALERFRFAPEQECENLWYADLIARGSLVEAEGGWTWAFDPFLWARSIGGDSMALLEAPRCPVALVWGERSSLMPPAVVEAIRRRLPAGTPAVAVPDADHHVMVDQPLALVATVRALIAA
jgi:pimeloyl-ACP methyl ester carboxylesterase